jgi:gluconolactonase
MANPTPTREESFARFPLGPDSLPQPGVPKGRVEKFGFSTSRIFPGTVRDYYVYVPVQYDPARPACVVVFQDGQTRLDPGIRWQVPTILDNMIHKGDIPVCIGVLIDPGTVPADTPEGKPRVNRSYEYDRVDDLYARFVLDEILPEVAGRYNLATDPGSRMIMGGSSGGVCSFIAAWHRPDGFGRVFSDVGSFAALRGGNTLAARVRMTEPKPIRVFLQSGKLDIEVYAGNWWTVNQDMLAALEYAGYEVNHCWHDLAAHDDGHGVAIFPDAMRWLWRDYPAPIQAGKGSRAAVMRVLIPGEGWAEVEGGGGASGHLAAGPGGEVCFFDAANHRIARAVPGGAVTVVSGDLEGITDLRFGQDGRIEACQPSRGRVLAFGPAGAVEVLAEGIPASSQCTAPGGGRYLADTAGGALWHVASDGTRRVVSREVREPRCVRLTQDQAGLVVTSGRGRCAHHFAARREGSLEGGAPFYRLQIPDETCELDAGQVEAFNPSWLAVATGLGVQLVTLQGSTAAILPPPGPGRVTGVAFGGADRCDLHVACGGRLYRRRIRPAENLWC